MKKQFFFLLASFFAVSLWAQSSGTERRENSRPEPVSVSGTLVLADGFIVLKSGDTLYYTGGLERLVGFIDGLKENAQVRLEGYDFSGNNARRTRDTVQAETRHFLRVTKLEIDGRSYETGRIAGNVPGQGPWNFQSGHMRGFGPDFGCRPDAGRSDRRGFDGPAFGKPGSGRHGRHDRSRRFGGRNN
jgi:hypothetical protein